MCVQIFWSAVVFHLFFAVASCKDYLLLQEKKMGKQENLKACFMQKVAMGEHEMKKELHVWRGQN